MIRPLSALLLTLFMLGMGAPGSAQELELVPCGRDDWGIRANLQLGPQYFTQAQDLVQFSFGAEGRVRLWGPLAFGLSSSMGVIETTGLVSAGSLRLHLVRWCNMELGADARVGVWLDLDHSSDPRLVAGGALELLHDLGGGRFFIGLRAGGGYLDHDDFGGFVDLNILLGVNWFLEERR